jgi:hypothetical protein
VEWNADVLLRLLNQIIAKRGVLGKSGWDEDEEPVLERKEGVTTPFEEVSEVIDLPGFDTKAYTHPKAIDVDPQVAAQLREFVSAIASAYRSNPFHCLQHASQVTMAVTKLISRIVVSDFIEEEAQQYTEEENSDEETPQVTETIASHLHNHTFGLTSDPLTQFAVVLSALIHAVDHRGISNADLAKEEPKAAAQFKGRGLTEQRSVDKAWAKLMEPQFKALRRCIYADESELKRFRQVVVNSVLATDIDDVELQSLRAQRWSKTFGAGFLELTEEDSNRKATIVLECLMQSSDVFHSMQHWHVYLKWSERLFNEMNTAFKAGRSKEDPAITWYKLELEFFDNYVIPLAMQLKDIDAFVVGSDEYLNYALKNRQRWASTGKDVCAALIFKYNGTGADSAALAKALTEEPEQQTDSADAEIPKHLQRLVGWNVEVLQRLLTQILAKRAAAGKSSNNEIPALQQEEGKNVVDEITEAITFPEFNATTSGGKLDPSSVEVSVVVADQLFQYVNSVSCKFRNNPFHCLDHGSQVSMTANKLLSRIVTPANFESNGERAADLHKLTFGISSDPLAQFAVVFASLIHDVDHSGVPNSQLVRENGKLATKYKARSITEQHSVDTAWNHLMQPGFEDLRVAIFADEEEMKHFRQIIVNSVLATDCTDEHLVALHKARWAKAYGDSQPSSEREVMNLKATTVLVTLMQAADAFHAMQHWQLYQKWNERHFNEIYSAFIAGRLKQDPSVFWFKSELLFLDEHVIPLCNQMKECGVFGASANECLKFALTNRQNWAAKGGNLVASMMARFHGKGIEKARQAMSTRRRSLSAQLA